MTNRAAHEVTAILNDAFAQAWKARKTLSAEELMDAIGLSRTSIYSTYADVNIRRERHNQRVKADRGAEQATVSNRATPRRDDQATITRLRRERDAERERSAGYARVIRELTIQLMEAQPSIESVVDARSRFGASTGRD